MVFIFGGEQNKICRGIASILKKNGAYCICGNTASGGGGIITAVFENETANISVREGIAVFTGGSQRFYDQKFPKKFIGICEEGDVEALRIFKKNSLPVICCGMGTKNTVTISSLSESSAVIALQREITDIYGLEHCPEEFRISLSKEYENFAIMTAFAVLLLNGIVPDAF